MEQKNNEMSSYAKTIIDHKYAHILKNGNKETWENIAYRCTKNVLRSVGYTMRDSIANEIFCMIRDRKFLPAGRYLYASGRPYHQTQNCLLLKAEDSREGWSNLMYKSGMALMSGAGIGVDYSDIRGEGKIIRKTGGTCTGPIALMEIINEAGRRIMQGGSRRSAIWSGLKWNHPDIFKYIMVKNWNEHVRKGKELDYNFPATLDMTNISVILDDNFFNAYNDDKNPLHPLANSVYWKTVERMFKTSEPGFSIDVGKNSGENLRNACTEVTSADDSDICNLGSINMARINNIEEMKRVVELGTVFLLAGTIYSDVPYPQVDSVRTKNRRLGLGLMGLHEWLLKKGKKYGPDDELEQYLKVYATSTEISHKYADIFEITKPVKTRAIAPTGTIGIVAETTTGIEPIFCSAYKRRYLKHNTWFYQYVLDPTAKRLVNEHNIDPDDIEDAYTLANDIEIRLKFQHWVQKYVDHGISSTINLPAWGSKYNNQDLLRSNGNKIMKYLKGLRGVTVYADGSRSGQPLNPVKYSTAIKHIDKELQEGGDCVMQYNDVCDITKGGSCGD